MSEVKGRASLRIRQTAMGAKNTVDTTPRNITVSPILGRLRCDQQSSAKTILLLLHTRGQKKFENVSHVAKLTSTFRL
jgi:hypothetical protein